MYQQLFILFGLIIFSAFFSASETALVSVSPSKVDELVAKKVKNSKLLRKMKDNPHKLIITVLIGNNIVNIGASAYAAVIFTDKFGSSGVGIATGIMTFLILVFGEITPKSFAHQYSAGFALMIAKPIYVLQIALFPLVWFFDKIVVISNKLIGTEKQPSVTEGEIMAMLNIGIREGSIEKQERELIENVLEFNDIEVEEVMTPRVSIDALSSEMTIQEAVDYAIKHSHSRLPVYNKDLDHIVGVISIKELLRYFDECSPRKKLKSLKLNSPLEVPFSKKINKLFREFQRKHQHIAIVIDEYGGTAGLVTMENLLEEIVGDIVDEFDVHEIPIEVVDKNTIIVNGSFLIEDVHDFFRLKFWPDERDTLNTMIVDHIHRFPLEGEVIRLSRVTITILKMNKNMVSQVKIRKRAVSKSD